MRPEINLSKSDISNLIAESIITVLSEAKKKKVADRHEYWHQRWLKQKAEKAKAKAEQEALETQPNQPESKPTSTDRHRPGYYEEYAKKTKKKDRHRKGYYRDYNKAHPERLDRGFTKGYNYGCVSDGRVNDKTVGMKIGPGTYVRGYDKLGRPITNDPIADLLRNRETEWNELRNMEIDDWDEDSWDD